MRHKTTQTVFDYFNRVRDGKSAPLRADIDPNELKSVLPNVFILGTTRNGGPVFRLAGTRICALLGRELRGEDFMNLWHGPNRHKMKLATEAVLANQAPLTIDVSTFADEEDQGHMEMLLAPLSSRSGVYDRLIGSLVDLGHPLLIGERNRILRADAIHFVAQENAGTMLRINEPTSYATVTVAPSSLRKSVMHLRVLEGGRKD
jgi:hypothetical protein